MKNLAIGTAIVSIITTIIVMILAAIGIWEWVVSAIAFFCLFTFYCAMYKTTDNATKEKSQ